MQAVFSPDCDVVIVNYNAGVLLIDCVASAFAENAGRVIVVDNASADGSLEALEHANKGKHSLIIIHNDANLGFAAACNIGFSQSKSDFVLFLNPDCRLDEEAISALLRVLQTDAAVGMVGGLLVNPDGSEQGGGRRAVPTPWRSLVRALGLNRFAKHWPTLFF